MPITARFAAAAALFVMLAGCGARPEPPPPQLWQSTEGRDHPLAGRIWRARDGALITPRELGAELARAQYVLLGETHDNPDHHNIQAWAVNQIFAAGLRPGLAVEMIREDQQPVLDTYRGGSPGDAAGLGPALGWDRSGWPDWELYRPIFAPFVHANTPIRAANLTTPMVRAVARQGYSPLGGTRMKTIALEQPVDSWIEHALAQEMVASHCGHISPDQAQPLVRVQVARDALMAGALRAAAEDTGHAVLIAGAGHVRTDRGVPWHLRRQGVKGVVLSLAPVEVAPGATTPRDYDRVYGTEVPPFDYVWFTARHARADPCEAMNARKINKL